MASHLLLFVCTGNVCRSPMAEYLLRERLGGDGAWEVRSAGLAALSGMPASAAAVATLRESGIGLGSHRSRPLTRELIDAASLIVVMTAGHRNQVTALSPRAIEKTFLLSTFNAAANASDIDDPIGLSLVSYRGVRDEIVAALPGLVAFMNSLQLD